MSLLVDSVKKPKDKANNSQACHPRKFVFDAVYETLIPSPPHSPNSSEAKQNVHTTIQANFSSHSLAYHTYPAEQVEVSAKKSLNLEDTNA
jgi:hypothetical protein